MSERPDDDILSLTEHRGLSVQGMDRLHRHIASIEARLAAYETATTSATVDGIVDMALNLGDPGTTELYRAAVTALVAERDAQADAVMQAAHMAVVDLLARAERAEAVVNAARNLLIRNFKYSGFRTVQVEPQDITRLSDALDAYDAGGTDGQ